MCSRKLKGKCDIYFETAEVHLLSITCQRAVPRLRSQWEHPKRRERRSTGSSTCYHTQGPTAKTHTCSMNEHQVHKKWWFLKSKNKEIAQTAISLFFNLFAHIRLSTCLLRLGCACRLLSVSWSCNFLARKTLQTVPKLRYQLKSITLYEKEQ